MPRPGRTTIGALGTGVVLALALTVVACSSEPASVAPPTTPSTADTLPPDTVLSSAVEVFTGSEPRRQLRLNPEVGSTSRTVVAYVENSTYQVSYVQGGPVAVPPITATVTTTIDAVDPDGTIRATYRYDSVSIDTSGLDASTAAEAMASFSSLNGVTGTIAVRPTGAVTAFRTDPPPRLDQIASLWLARLGNSIQQLIVAFPTEAVGEGALWKVPLSLDFDGLTSSASYTVRVTRLSTDRIDLELTYEQTAPLGPVPVAGLPPGLTAELLSFRIEGAGTQQSDLTQLLPPSSALDASGSILFRVLGDGTDTRMDQKIAIEVTATPG